MIGIEYILKCNKQIHLKFDKLLFKCNKYSFELLFDLILINCLIVTVKFVFTVYKKTPVTRTIKS
jgi:hypothetical protein